MYKYKSTSIIKDVIIKYKYKEKYKSPESLLDCSRFEPLHVYTIHLQCTCMREPRLRL